MDNTQDFLGNDSEVSCITLQHEYDPYLPTHPSPVIPEETLEDGINTPPPSCVNTPHTFLRTPTPVNSTTPITVDKPVQTPSEPVSKKSLQGKKNSHEQKVFVETHSTPSTSEIVLNPPLKLQKTQPSTSMKEKNVQPPTLVQGDLSTGIVYCPVL